MDMFKNLKFKYLQNTYRPGKRQSSVEKTSKIINDIEKALDDKITKLFDNKDDKKKSKEE